MGLYVFNAWHLDTTPGNLSSPFSPSLDWEGDENDYLHWLRRRFRSSPEIRQRLAIAARASHQHRTLQLTGPFSDVLRLAINRLNKAERKDP